MNWFKKIKKVISNSWQKVEPSSLRMRITLGVATVSALGLGSVTMWTGIRIQQILIETHKQNIEDISERFPQDVGIYNQMIAQPKGIQKAVDNITTNNTLIWVKDPNKQVIAQSDPMKMGIKGTTLVSLTRVPSIPQIQRVEGRYWLLCAAPLELKGQNIGKYYIAQDITSDQTMFLMLMGNVGLASLLSLGLITVAIAMYVKRSLQPLETICKLTSEISVNELGKTQIELKNPPYEVKKLAATFEEMLVRLSDSWEHQRQLLSNVSHELRTPLTIVSGYLQSTLRRGDNLTQIQREALETASSEADRTIQLMQDLLDLARIDSGRMHFAMEVISLQNIVEEVIGMAREYSKREIYFESGDRLISIKADVNRLKQVLLNLIDNAVKYSDEKEPITVKLTRLENKVNILVCDRGIGIPLAKQGRIFERFYRVDDDRSRATGGTGLGLSIVKTLVEGMGGTISLRSNPGVGSTFIVTFLAINSPMNSRDSIINPIRETGFQNTGDAWEFIN